MRILKALWNGFLWLAKWFVRIVYCLGISLLGLVIARATYLSLAHGISETGPVRWVLALFGKAPNLAYWRVTGQSRLDADIALSWVFIAGVMGLICLCMICCTPESHPRRGSFWDNAFIQWWVRAFATIRGWGGSLWTVIVKHWFVWTLVGFIAWPIVLMFLYYAFPGAHHWVMGFGPNLAALVRPIAVNIVYFLLLIKEVITTGYWP